MKYCEAGITMSLMEEPSFTVVPMFGCERACSEGELREAMGEMGMASLVDDLLGPARTSLSFQSIPREHTDQWDVNGCAEFTRRMLDDH
jgi:hypothetical protein